MATDEMGPAIAVRLGVNNQHGFADLRLESILARKRADLPSKTTCVGTILRMSSSLLGK
jgi:hypothetical protein